MLRKSVKNLFCTINAADKARFDKVTDWWTVGGSMQALWSYNHLRIKYIHRIMGLKQQQNSLQGLNALDIGCGGGILSEVHLSETQSLRRLGANVLGIDVSDQSIRTALGHKGQDPILKNDSGLQYQLMKPEDLEGQYNLVTSMEVIEHVENKTQFIQAISQRVAPGGTLFMSTMDKTFESYLKMIVGAEYITGIVPINTHQWELFISPSQLQKLLEQNGLEVIDIQGVEYNIITGEMSESSNKTQYMLAARIQ